MAEYPENQSDSAVRKSLEKAYRQLQQEQQIKELMHQLLDSNAYERLMNIRISNKQLYMQLANIILSLAQSQQIEGKVTDKQLVALLNKLTAKKESRIEFKRK